MKTLAREWLRVRIRVVDFDPREPVEFIAQSLVNEVMADDVRAEVGYLDRRRIMLLAEDCPHSDERPGSGFTLDPGDPIIVTGGARGITAAVASDFAQRWKPTLLLIGSSHLPTEPERGELSFEGGPSEIKARLLKKMRRGGRAVTPAELEAAYRSLQRDREIRSNIDRLRAAGSTVEYASVDVRDRDSMARVLEDWKDRHGPAVGVIHGAGLIQDKLLLDKSIESFEHVFGTKVEGALNLAGLLDPDSDSLKFAAFFSSIAGRFGNRGQIDYAAANEVLSKLAIWLDQRWRARVVSMMWGPWSGAGLVSELEAHLERQGFGMIAPGVGRALLADELRLGRKGEVEVVVAGSLGDLADVSNHEAVAGSHS